MSGKSAFVPFPAKGKGAEARSSSSGTCEQRAQPAVAGWAPGASLPEVLGGSPAQDNSVGRSISLCRVNSEVAELLVGLKAQAATKPEPKKQRPAQAKRRAKLQTPRKRKTPVTISSLTAQLNAMAEEQEQLQAAIQESAAAQPALRLQLMTQTAWLAAARRVRSEVTAEIAHLRTLLAQGGARSSGSAPRPPQTEPSSTGPALAPPAVVSPMASLAHAPRLAIAPLNVPPA